MSSNSKIHWNDMTPEQQAYLKNRFCSNCLSKGRAMCNPETFPYYHDHNACECCPGDVRFSESYFSGMAGNIGIDIVTIKLPKGTVLKPEDCKPGTAQYAPFDSSLKTHPGSRTYKEFIQYDFRHPTKDYFFSCAKQTLQECIDALVYDMHQNDVTFSCDLCNELALDIPGNMFYGENNNLHICKECHDKDNESVKLLEEIDELRAMEKRFLALAKAIPGERTTCYECMESFPMVWAAENDGICPFCGHAEPDPWEEQHQDER